VGSVPLKFYGLSNPAALRAEIASDACGSDMLSRPTGENMPTARARHILVSSEDDCLNLKTQIEGGADFAKLAAQHSTCPSGNNGGDLGEFGPGQMVPEFDRVVFAAKVGVVQGPVQTQFGYHLIEITERTD
jgi:peptidyl-prolyl cis-trans isomerase C